MNSIPHSRQNITQEDIDVVVETLKSDFLTRDPTLVASEKAFAEYIDVTYAQVYYIQVHTTPYYKNFSYKKGDFPLSEKYYGRCLSFPIFPTLTTKEQEFVIEKIH
jgi:dTDP-4-amino-4,6-dideoxygalactose transaminase